MSVVSTGRVFVTGGTGLVGSRLVKKLAERRDLKVVHVSRWEGYHTSWTKAAENWSWRQLEQNGFPEDTKAVIHLAGSPVAEGWSKALSSRLEGLELIKNAINPKSPPAVVIATSGATFKSSGLVQEDAEVQDGQKAIENSAQAAQAHVGVKRVAILRPGMVLGNGENTGKLISLFNKRLGGTFGCGKQFFPWIHVDDLVNLYIHVLDHNISGPVNAVSPVQITNKEFTRALSEAVDKPAVLMYPSFLLNTVLGKDVANLMLSGSKVDPAVAKSTGFVWKHSSIDGALQGIVADYEHTQAELSDLRGLYMVE